jgi:uncharacterized protein (TIGR00290 family)
MWSGGKDSTLALLRARARGLDIAALINFYDPATDRVRFHATRRGLIAAQADAIGVELRQYGVPWDAYDATFQRVLGELGHDGFRGVVLGDIHLADVRAWYETRVRAAGLEHVEPLWGESPARLLDEFVASGSRAVVTCVQRTKLDDSWLGRIIDTRFSREISRLPIDPAGENGEYHSFAYDGPAFRSPVGWRPGARRDEGDFAQLDLEPARVAGGSSGPLAVGPAGPREASRAHAAEPERPSPPAWRSRGRQRPPRPG